MDISLNYINYLFILFWFPLTYVLKVYDLIYSDALERVFFPVLNELADGCLSFSHQWFLDESRIEALLQLLQNFDALDGTSLSILVGKLCGQLESFMMRISKHLAFQETEVHSICGFCYFLFF